MASSPLNPFTVINMNHSDDLKSVALLHAQKGHDLLLISKNASIIELAHEIETMGVQCRSLQITNDDDFTLKNIISALSETGRTIDRFFVSKHVNKSDKLLEKIIISVYKAGSGSIYYLKKEGNFISDSLKRLALNKNIQIIPF